MSDIIKLLPDSVANQIAAGEVITRPASAVKELLENSIDSGATDIKLYIKDAGKTLVQVVDNGCGMSETDARMCFERHATSKLSKAEDLFNIRTKGFRGEAMAAIAAIAQLEMKTRKHEDTIGTLIEIEGSVCKKQEPTTCSAGTNISVKNLFFNVPARRNFLKSNNQETRHIIDEFERVALPHFELSFSLIHNGLEVYSLKPANFRQRICSLMGSNYNERLVPVEEDTTIISISGFVCKPEFAKRTRGEQYFFINNRFVKDANLHYAVFSGFEDLLPKETHPSYFLKIEINPAQIDINIHPTKTEIKFEDERSVHAILRAAVKRSLGRFSISPSLDFDHEKSLDLPLSKMDELPKAPQIKITPGYNPFKADNYVAPEKKSSFPIPENQEVNLNNWRKIQEEFGIETVGKKNDVPSTIEHSFLSSHHKQDLAENIFQIKNAFIVLKTNDEVWIVDQQAAHEKILYEKTLAQMNNHESANQQQLFPVTITVTAQDFELLKEIMPDLKLMGFDINEFGVNTFVLHGMPGYITKGGEQKLIESIIEQYKHQSKDFKIDSKNKLAVSVAKELSIKKGQLLFEKEMKHLIQDLMLCNNPSTGLQGKAIIYKMGSEDLSKIFDK